MAATLPALTLECSGCGHRWPSRARAGSSIRCPRCRRVRRVPAARPRTAAQARAEATSPDDSEAARLAELWAAERPAADWRHDLEGPAGHDCPQCGGPMQWAGAHTVLLCPARHDDGRAKRDASPGAYERETEHARASAAPERASGPSAAELAEVAQEREVALDHLEGMRQQLGQIPRDDSWRADAVRALHKLGQVEQQYRAAHSLADLDAADAAEQSLTGELDDVLRRADKLARRQARRDRGGILDRFRRGDDGVYELDASDDDDYPDPDDAQPAPAEAPPCDMCLWRFQERPAIKRAARPGSGRELDVCDEHWRTFGAGARVVADYTPGSGLQLPVVPGYMPPDPNWRRSMPPAAVAYWDRITPATGSSPADDYWARYDAETARRARADAEAAWRARTNANGGRR